MKENRKILAILLALILMASTLIGCGGSSDTSGTEQAEQANGEQAEKAEDADTGEMGDLLSAAYVDMMKNNEYLMTYKATMDVQGQQMQVEATIAVSGEKSAMISKGDGFESTIIIKDDKIFMVDHTSKTVTSWVQEQQEETGAIDTEGITYVGSGEEAGLAYEEYSTEGDPIKYYFDGKNLVKIATTVEGQTLIMDIVKMSKDVPADLFEVPAGYQIIEM